MFFSIDDFTITNTKNNRNNINTTLTRDSTLQSSNRIDDSDFLNSSREEKNISQEPEPVTNFLIKYTKFNKKNCFYMIELKLVKKENLQFFRKQKNFLKINCHEVAAVSFDNFYERIYSFENLCEEIKYFKAFDRTEDIKFVLDDLFHSNQKKRNKIFISIDNYENLNLHLRLSYFDREKEIILKIPKKNISNKEKLILLPGLLKEVQDKMNYLQNENKKLQNKMPKYYVSLNRSNGFINYKNFKGKFLSFERENGKVEKNIVLENGLKKIIHNANKSVDIEKDNGKESIINFNSMRRTERIWSNKKIKKLIFRQYEN